jgi:hypothetical protein
VGASQFLRSQPPLEISVAVSPLAEAWVRTSAEAFNSTNPVVNGTQRVMIRVQAVDDTAVWQDGTRSFANQQPPAAWIPALAASVDYAVEARLPFERHIESCARTLLVWGVFDSRAQVVGIASVPFDWQRVQEVAAAESWGSLPGGQSSWGFVKLAFSSPQRSAAGLGVLLSGAAAYNQDPLLTTAAITDTEYRNWIAPVLASVPNFNALGADAAAALTRGPSTGEIALLPESQWLMSLAGITAREPILLRYPAYAMVFDFPIAIWNDAQTILPGHREAAEQFAAWLMQPAPQARATEFGLRPAVQPINASAALFLAGEAYGIQMAPELVQPIVLPERDAVLRLLTWSATTR